MAARGHPITCLFAGLVSACATERSGPEVPAALAIVAGNSQVDTIEATLVDSLAIRVTAASGHGIGMVRIRWSAGSGVVRPESTATDPSGIAKAQWTLGSDLGEAHVTVSLLDSTQTLTDSFTATVNPGHAARVLLTPYGSPQILVGSSLPIAAIVRDRLGHTLVNPSIQWTSSTPGVATVSDSAASTPDVSGFGVVHPVGNGKTFIAAQSGGVRDSTAVVVVRDTAVFGGYDLQQRDSVAFPYCQYPSPNEIWCFSGSLEIDGIGGFAAKRYTVVTLVLINQTLIDSSVTTGTYQTLTPCQLTLIAAGEPEGDALKSLDVLTVSSDSTSPAPHRWGYHAVTRPQTCP